MVTAAVCYPLGMGYLCCTGLVGLGAKLEGSPLRFLANLAWVTCSAQKTA